MYEPRIVNCFENSARRSRMPWYPVVAPQVTSRPPRASERTLCCILENYQTKDGVVVPKALVPYVGTDFIPYTKDMPKKEKLEA